VEWQDRVMNDPLLARAHGLWEDMASAPVSFAPAGSVSVVVSPRSRMCPPGWVGVVVLGGSAIVTVPSESAAAVVCQAFAGMSVAAVADADAVCSVLPVSQVLGPAVLAFVAADGFRPTSPGLLVVEQLQAQHPDLRRLETLAGEQDADEASLDEVTSPVFVVRAEGEVVAASGYRAWPAQTAHISVLTAPNSRGRGLARVTGSAAVDHALTTGLMPQWRARPAASRRVAVALGFRELGAQLSFKLAED
jgi:hypothetical protein